MKSNKKNKNINHNFNKIFLISLLFGLILALVLFVYKNDLLNIRDSDAQSKHYSKTYPAGDIVEKGRVRVQNSPEMNNENPEDRPTPYVNWRSIGRKVKISPKKGSAKINGWATSGTQTDSYGGNFRMGYISKLITVPKPENIRNRPMSIQLCWKAKHWNTGIIMTLYRERARVWYPLMAQYSHRDESSKTASKLGCFGFRDYIFDTYDYSGDPVNRQIKVRLYVAVQGGPIEIAAIKVKSIPSPDLDQANMRSDFNTGEYFTDGSGGQTK